MCLWFVVCSFSFDINNVLYQDINLPHIFFIFMQIFYMMYAISFYIEYHMKRLEQLVQIPHDILCTINFPNALVALLNLKEIFGFQTVQKISKSQA